MAIAVLAGPEHVFELVNRRDADFVGRRSLLGRTVRETFPDIDGQGFYELFGRVYATGGPLELREVEAHFGRAGASGLPRTPPRAHALSPPSARASPTTPLAGVA